MPNYFNIGQGNQWLRLLFMLATEHTLLRMFLNIWGQILFPGDLHDDAFRISVQLSVEP